MSPPNAPVMNSMRLFVVLLPWQPCSWYSTRTKLFELNRSATEWLCLVLKIIMGELILMNLCQPALEVQVFLRHNVVFLTFIYFYGFYCNRPTLVSVVVVSRLNNKL